MFVKMANILVSEKRGHGLYHNMIVLIQFLDATAAFDKCLQEIILRDLYLAGVEGDAWDFIYNMHKNARKVIKWQGVKSEELITESSGSRQAYVLMMISL